MLSTQLHERRNIYHVDELQARLDEAAKVREEQRNASRLGRASREKNQRANLFHLDMHKRKLPPPMAFASECERDAFIKNKNEQALLDKYVDHVDLELGVYEHAFTKEMQVVKVKGDILNRKADAAHQRAQLANEKMYIEAMKMNQEDNHSRVQSAMPKLSGRDLIRSQTAPGRSAACSFNSNDLPKRDDYANDSHTGFKDASTRLRPKSVCVPQLNSKPITGDKMSIGRSTRSARPHKTGACGFLGLVAACDNGEVRKGAHSHGGGTGLTLVTPSPGGNSGHSESEDNSDTNDDDDGHDDDDDDNNNNSSHKGIKIYKSTQSEKKKIKPESGSNSKNLNSKTTSCAKSKKKIVASKPRLLFDRSKALREIKRDVRKMIMERNKDQRQVFDFGAAIHSERESFTRCNSKISAFIDDMKPRQRGKDEILISSGRWGVK